MEHNIKFVNGLPRRRNGLNYYSSKHFRFKIPIKENEILVCSGLENEKTFRIIQREKCEEYYLKKGFSYRRAHRISVEIEKIGLEFPDELLVMCENTN